MQTNKTYLFSVGTADEERLNIQNSLCDPYTNQFIQENLPDLTGKTILDVGCGTGIVSGLWAEKIGKTGKVIAIDISAEQLAVAKKNTSLNNLTNIEFIEADANELDKLNKKFDVVYCRFFLMHVQNQELIIQKMLDCVKPNGYLFCEEVISYDAFLSDPDSGAFQAWKNLILKLPQISNTNYFIGKTLNSTFHHLNLKKIKSEIRQPIIQKEHDKGYLYLGFTEQFKQKFIDKGLATLEEINTILNNLKKEILNKPWTGSAVQHIQILGKK